MTLQNIIQKNKEQISLTIDESVLLFSNIMEGNLSDDEIKSILINFSKKGETVEEITGGVKVLRDKCLKVNIQGDIIDTCGTGGDGRNTINISTAVAITLGSMGLKVAKHGNKSVSSKSGSANVLEKLGVDINKNPEQVIKSLEENNFAFMFAPNYHSAMKHVAKVRGELKQRTIFNLLGPLLNPAKVNRQCIGVYSIDILEKYIKVLKNIGLKKAWVFHSLDGLDEISIFEITKVYQLSNNEISKFEIDPKKFIKTSYTIEDIIGGDPDYNAEILEKTFRGEESACTEIIALNCAAGLVVLDKYSSIEEAYSKSKKHLLSGKVSDYLNKIKK